jgi:hypothetical protein
MFGLGVFVSLFLYSNSCRPHCPSKLNQIKIFGRTLHLHHWLTSLLALTYFKNSFVRGLLVGGVIHGIGMYDDWYKIIK